MATTSLGTVNGIELLKLDGTVSPPPVCSNHTRL